MGNYIKYSTNAQTNALKIGNFWLGPTNDGKGPTSSTGYYTAFNPTTGTFVVYQNKASNGPAIYSASNQSELVSITNKIAGASYTTSAQCLTYYVTQTDKFCVNRQYEDIVTNGLVLNLDAGFTPSYPTSGTSWYDLGPSGNTGTLTNGPTFNSGNGGSIVFDGVDDYAIISSTSSLTPSSGDFTIDFWINPIWNGTYGPIFVANNNNGIWVGRNSANFVIRAYNVADRLSYNVLPTQNVWTYITVGRTGTTLFLYYNGVNVSTSTSSQNFIQSDIYIGSDGYPGFPVLYTGKISNVKYYNRALTSVEVLQNYKSQKGRFGL